MHIAMLSTPFVPVPPRDYGGTELVVYELVEGLLDRGHEVTLFGTGDSHTRARLRSLYPHGQWPPEPLTDLNHVSWAMQQIADGEYDVVHAHSAAALALARLTTHLPLVYTLHHAQDATLSAYYRHFPEVRFVAISADQRRREPGVAESVVIHHGLDPLRYHWTADPEPYVCFVGRFAREKGLHTAIDAAELAGVAIRVAGDVHPPNQEYFHSEVVPRLRKPHVATLGCIGTAQKVPLLRNARALLAPIDWNEPFGLILIEAMLSGCPVVSFSRGSVPELVEPGITGFIAGSTEEMAELIRPGGAVDQLDRRRVRARALRRFSRERMLLEYEVLYRSLVAKPGRTDRLPITAA
ncbi:MAG TPA: glycosyltransferase family 4 protein [Gemmatimonadales bacterium]|jgi:glycosyltransferase involved in cell wall biosynthesis|nr:glycosyltransferase family 4 protein [Gemmatimonadales bacterium]